MLLSDLDYLYPESLVATEKSHPSRVMLAKAELAPEEIEISQLLELFQPGDVLVVNDTKVLKRRIFSEQGLEILFLNQVDDRQWDVLFPASRVSDAERVYLPRGVHMQLVTRGLPQRVQLSEPVDETYFEACGELPLPPYIQKARGARHTVHQDEQSYQTAWAQKPGSFAAPTASLHFSNADLSVLQERGVQVHKLTLHVGLGTFLPVKTENLDHHTMHPEWVEIPLATWGSVQKARAEGHRVWALGTTVTRALESAACGGLALGSNGYQGFSELFIREPFEFQIVSALLTNFHQPKSTLLALVGAFAGLQTVKHHYAWAIERQFRLFSYGDLTVWLK